MSTSRFLFLICTALVWTSCNYFDTQKVSSETLIEEERLAINWDDVDVYPSFLPCDSYTDKEPKKNCFITTLQEEVYERIMEHKAVVSKDIDASIKVHLSITEKGILHIDSIANQQVVEQQLPDLEKWLYESFSTLQLTAPAYKRGIPVRTSFVLPIKIKTE